MQGNGSPRSEERGDPQLPPGEQLRRLRVMCGGLAGWAWRCALLAVPGIIAIIGTSVAVGLAAIGLPVLTLFAVPQSRARLLLSVRSANNRLPLLHFPEAVVLIGLGGPKKISPRVRKVKANGVCLRFQIRLSTGPGLDEWQAKAQDLSDNLGVPRVDIGRTAPGWASVTLFRREPLGDVIKHPRTRSWDSG